MIAIRKLDIRILIVGAAGLLVSLPCLIYGFPFYGDDSVSNAIYYSNFSRQFWQGELYPRWLQGLNAGFGGPIAYYYPPVAYWFTSFLRIFFANDPYGWHQLGVSAAIAVIASGIAFYLWSSRTLDRKSALIASLVYVFLPYHVSIDLYGRGALAELWTFVWMPLVLASVDALLAHRRLAFVCLAVAYGLLVMTHLPTTLIFSLIPIGYAFYLAEKGERAKVLFETVAAMSLGVGISAIYLIPALTKQQFIFHTTEGISGHYYFANWFLFSRLKWSGAGSDVFLATVWAFGLACLALILVFRLSADQTRRKIQFWFVIAVCSFFMTTSLSDPIWRLLPELQKIQFPWRFNTALSVAAAASVAFAVFLIDKTHSAKRIVLYVALSLCGVTWIYTCTRKAYYSYRENYVDQAIINSVNKRLQQQRDTSEFRPRWVTSISEQELDALVERVGQSGGEVKKADFVSGAGELTVVEWKPGKIILDVDNSTASDIRVSQFYFPGWRARVDDGRDITVRPSIPGGLINFSIPEGKHRVEVRLEKTLPEVIGEILSAFSLLLAGALLVRSTFLLGPRASRPQ